MFWRIFSLAALICWQSSAQVVDYIDGSVEQTCDASADECYITCDGAFSCRYKTLYCPSGNGCDYCYINCTGAFACQEGFVYGYNCTLLQILFGEDAYTGDGLTIYAPNDNGSLLIDTTANVYATYAFRGAMIHSGDQSSNEIIINCRGNATASAWECREPKIYGKTANYVELNCVEETYCYNVDIGCPLGSNKDGTSNPSCFIHCDGSSRCEVNAYLWQDTWENNVNLDCASGTSCTVNVYCNYDGNFSNTQDSCTMTQGGTCVAATGTGCQNISPTGNPTPSGFIAPTPLPATAPVSVPAPTAIPSAAPSRIPTIIPTTIPSGIPSKIPSTLPSAIPTTIPSTIPSTVPSEIPTAIPSSEPSDEPSSDPTSEPSHTNEPTAVPTDEPTREPCPVVTTCACDDDPSTTTTQTTRAQTTSVLGASSTSTSTIVDSSTSTSNTDSADIDTTEAGVNEKSTSNNSNGQLSSNPMFWIVLLGILLMFIIIILGIIVYYECYRLKHLKEKVLLLGKIDSVAIGDTELKRITSDTVSVSQHRDQGIHAVNENTKNITHDEMDANVEDLYHTNSVVITNGGSGIGMSTRGGGDDSNSDSEILMPQTTNGNIGVSPSGELNQVDSAFATIEGA